MMKRRKSKEMEEVDENEMPNKCKYRVEQYYDQTPSKYRVGPNTEETPSIYRVDQNTEETSSKYNMSQQTEEAHSKYRVGQILPTPLFGRSSKTVRRHECNKLDTESLDPHIAESEACQVMISRPTNTTILRGDTFDLNQFLNEHRQKENTCPSSPSRHHHGMVRSQKVVRPDTRSQRYSVEDLPHPNSLKHKKGSRSKKQSKRGQCGMDLAGYISRLNQKQSNWYDTDGPSTQSINRHCSVYATNSSTDHDPSAVYDTNISTDYYPPSVYAINSSTGHHSSMNDNADLSQLFNSYPQSYQSHSEHCEDDMKMWYPGTTTGIGKRSWVPSGEREYGVYPRSIPQKQHEMKRQPGFKKQKISVEDIFDEKSQMNTFEQNSNNATTRNLEYLQKYSENPRSHALQDVTPILPHRLQHETPTLYGQTAGYTPLNSRPLSGGKKHYANSAFRPKELFHGQVEHNGAISKQTDLSEGFQYTPRERKRSFHSAGDHSKSSFNVTCEDIRENAVTTEGPTQTFDLRIQPFRMNYPTNGASSSLYPYPREADDAPSRITTQQMSPSYP